MIKRTINILKSQSFFLFGARQTGKSSLLKDLFQDHPRTLWIDLLLPDVEDLYLQSPEILSQKISQAQPEWVILDEVQKVPRLLDVVHHEIETRGIKFALTGSSARKLKKGGANLLAGRAFLNHLYPFTFQELGSAFDLTEVLSWGSLPKIFSLPSELEKSEFLKTYTEAYLKEEIFQEQLVRNTVAFRRFLPIAAQMNGKILNFQTLAQDLHVDWTTVRTYYEILEDTYLGFFLPAFDESLRKQQTKSPKFYLFDIGIQRTLERSLESSVQNGQVLGPLFEHWIILEMHRLNLYHRKDFRFSYLRSQGGLEVDLVIERPNQKTILVEIKSSKLVRDEHLKHLKSLHATFQDRFLYLCISQERDARQTPENILICGFQKAFEFVGLI